MINSMFSLIKWKNRYLKSDDKSYYHQLISEMRDVQSSLLITITNIIEDENLEWRELA